MMSKFPGWRVVAGCFLVLMINCGLGFYGLAVYLAAFSKEQGWSVASISLATTIYFVVSGVVGVYVARLIGRIDVRWAITAGAVVGGVSLGMFGMIQSRSQLYLGYAVFGVGFALAGLVPVTTVVTRWFAVRRSVALSVASTGLSVGGIVVTPAAKWLLDARGLAAGAPVLGVVYVVGIIPFTWWLIKPEPATYGWEPDGARLDVERPRPAAVGVPVAEALRSRFFILLTLGFILALGAQVGAIQQLVKLVEERTSASVAAFATLVVALASVVARLGGGWLAEIVSKSRLTVGVAVVQGLSLFCIAYAQSSGALYVSIALFGATIGNLLMLHPLLLASRFGVRDYAAIYSRAMLFLLVGNAAGPYLLGYLHDRLGNYTAAYTVAGFLSLSGAVIIAAAGPSDTVVTESASAAGSGVGGSGVAESGVAESGVGGLAVEGL